MRLSGPLNVHSNAAQPPTLDLESIFWFQKPTILARIAASSPFRRRSTRAFAESCQQLLGCHATVAPLRINQTDATCASTLSKGRSSACNTSNTVTCSRRLGLTPVTFPNPEHRVSHPRRRYSGPEGLGNWDQARLVIGCTGYTNLPTSVLRKPALCFRPVICML